MPACRSLVHDGFTGGLIALADPMRAITSSHRGAMCGARRLTDRPST
ncbi:hypothetical protein ACIO6T_06805 [Streptomyces sp. NPDC087532]